MPETISKSSIGICGVNCLACSAHLSEKKPCPGCRAPREDHTRKSCRDCLKKQCALKKGLNWCFECDSFPCSKVQSLSRNYKKNYGSDLVQNGKDAKENMPQFLVSERKKFTCPHCGGVINQHYHICSECKSNI